MFKAEIKVRQLSFHTFWSSQMLTEHNFRGKYFLRMALQIEVGQVEASLILISLLKWIRAVINKIFCNSRYCTYINYNSKYAIKFINMCQSLSIPMGFFGQECNLILTSCFFKKLTFIRFRSLCILCPNLALHQLARYNQAVIAFL